MATLKMFLFILAFFTKPLLQILIYIVGKTLVLSIWSLKEVSLGAVDYFRVIIGV